HDGDLDILLTGYDGAGRVGRIYNNTAGSFAIAVNLAGVAAGSADWCDFDNDGDLDIVTSGQDDSLAARIHVYENGPENTPPSAPAGLTAVPTGNHVTLSWNAASDPETPVDGLSYNLYIYYDTGGYDVIAPMACTSGPCDGFRRVVSLGNAQITTTHVITGLVSGHYTWSVQAIDASFAGSSFAAGASFNVNNPPDAIEDIANVFEDSGANPIDVLSNDSYSPDVGETLTIAAVTQGLNGSVAITNGGLDLTYTPNPDTFGPDSFTYTISDGNGGTATATVYVEVTNENDPPVAANDAATVEEDSGANTIDVLANDNLISPDPPESLTIITVGLASQGSVTNFDTYLTYTPVPDYAGSDSFTYTISDGNGGEGTATVNVSITNFNDLPDAVDDVATVDEDNGPTLIEVLANDEIFPDVGETLTINTVTQGSIGSVDNFGTYLTYTPNPEIFGFDSFTYTISDGNGGTDTATVNVTVSPINDPPIGTDASILVDEDTIFYGTLGASDVDSSSFTFGVEVYPTHGSVAVDPSGLYAYAPGLNNTDPDSFTFWVEDDMLARGYGTVNVTVNPTINVNATSTVPESNETGVWMGTDINATFDMGLNASTVTSQTFVVNSSLSGRILAEPGYDGNINVTVDPPQDFFAGDIVSAIATSGIQAKSGNPLAPYQWQFTTGDNLNRFVPVDAGYLEPVGLSTAEWGDYDGDGDLDIVLSGMDVNEAAVSKIYRNDGGDFVDTGVSLAQVIGSAAAWGDYDNDGDLDLVLAGASGESSMLTEVYRNDGEDVFTAIGAGLPGVALGGVAWGDYDNDGDLDLVLAGISGESSMLTEVYRNDGADVFTAIGAGLPGVALGDVAWGDYDNDGDIDLLIAGEDGNGGATILYRNDGPGVAGWSFVDSGEMLTPVTFASLAWGDYDADGFLDVIIAGTYPCEGTCYGGEIFHNDGDSDLGYFNWVDTIDAGADGEVAWGDYDNDGDLDILGAGRLDASNTIAEVYRNDGGLFEPVYDASGGPAGGAAIWGDYNNDNNLDLLFTGEDAFGTLFTIIFENRGGWDVFREVTSTGLAPFEDADTAWGDFDRDGDLDVVFAGNDGTGPATTLYRNNGDKTFSPLPAGLEAVEASALAWGDYDNDGDLDLLLTGLNDAGTVVARLYRNDGPGGPGWQFTDAGQSLEGVFDSAVAWADYDNDGYLDFVLSGSDDTESPVTILYHNGGSASGFSFTDSGAGLDGLSGSAAAWSD
ncbi:MAG: tandem-95 repeat protein, partial [Planctomycetaceae bacterium]